MGGGLWFWAKEVLVGSGGLGVSRIFPENLPPQAFLSPPQPPFLSLDPFLQSLHPLNPSLHLSRSGLFTLSTLHVLFFLLLTPSYLLQPFPRPLLDLFRTPPESLHRVPQKPLKGPFQAFLGVFPYPQKGLKTPLFRPFLTPF